MKVVFLAILVTASSGCATLSTVPGAPVSGGSTVTATGLDFAPATSASPFPDQNIGPRIVMPLTGGAPLIGIPLGGNLYLPVTGGPPVMGMPTTP